MKPELVTITPSLANEWLQYNQGNRRLPIGNAKHYERLLKAGEWMLTHQALAFSGTRENPQRLLDGQTRLTAIAKTGISAQQWVFWSCDESTFAVLDGGKPRSFADHHGWDKDLISFVNVLFWLASGTIRPTKHEADAVRAIWGPYLERLLASSSVKQRNISCASVRAGFAVSMRQNPNHADEICAFYRSMTTQHLNELPTGVCKLFFKLQEIVGVGRAAMGMQVPMTVKLLSPENWGLAKVYQPKPGALAEIGAYVKAACGI